VKPIGLKLKERFLRTTWESRLLLVLALTLVTIVFANQFGVLTPDTKPVIFLQPLQTARRFALSWLDTPNLGTANYNTGNTPISLLFVPLDAIGVPAWVTMRLWRITLLLIGAWGARQVTKDLVGSSLGSRGAAVAGVAAAVAYSANPYVIVGGGTTPTLQPYALLPWLVLVWLRGFRAPSWRSAVLGALILAAMGGINAGAVPLMQLVVLIPLFAHAILVEGHRFRTGMWLILRTGVVYAALSAYWVVPAVGAFDVANSVAEATESLEAINMANSFAEVLRGLGMWTLYGVGSTGPFDPNRITFLTNPLVIALSFGGPILAGLGVRLSRSSARLFGATAVLVAALLMVGTFSPGQPTPWARLLAFSIAEVPGLVAFRTTNKFGGILLLGLAVLIGLGAAELGARWVSTGRRVTAALAAAAVTAGSVAPALTGGLFWVTMDVPEYWHDVAMEVNARGGESRVLMVPGVAVPEYSWGYTGPDELGPSLFTRPFAYRGVSLSGGEYAAAMMAGVDLRLQNGTLPEGTISTLADYIGAGDIVGRYDLVGVDLRGAEIEEQLSSDPGLDPVAVFGSGAEAHGAPGAATVRRVTLTDDSASVRVAAGQGALLIDGSGAALPALVASGLAEETPAILLAPALSDEQLTRALDGGARVVLTDSNVRREWSSSNPVGVGPVLPAEQPTQLTRAVFSSDAQTTSRVEGNARVEVRGDGLLFGPYPHTQPENAFDGDPTTAWMFGNFGTGVGNAVVIIPDHAMVMPSVTLQPAQSSGQWITSAKVTATAGDRTVRRDVTFTPWNTFPAQVEIGDEPVSRLEIEVTGVAGLGYAAVGFHEIKIPGLRVERTVSVSDHLAKRLGELGERSEFALADVPLDVVLERDAGYVHLVQPEPGLAREFTIPDRREFTVSGTVRLAPAVSDSRIDDLRGVAPGVRAESRSRLLHRPTARASMAVDATTGGRDQDTAWIPNDPVVGEWILLEFPERKVKSFTVTQPEAGPHASTVLVSVNDDEPFEATLTRGVTRVELPQAVDASRVRILITGVSGPGLVQFLNIGLPAIRWAEPTDLCRTLGWIDGTPIRARVGGHLDELLRGEPVPFTPCEGTLHLEAGTHRVMPVTDFSLDLLHLVSTVGPADSEASPPVPFEARRVQADTMTVTLPAGCFRCVLSTGQAFDSRWTAEIDGADLGPPTVVDGFAAGWQIDAPEGATVTMAFGPRARGLMGWWLSATAAVACLVVVLSPLVRTRASWATRGEAA